MKILFMVYGVILSCIFGILILLQLPILRDAFRIFRKFGKRNISAFILLLALSSSLVFSSVAAELFTFVAFGLAGRYSCQVESFKWPSLLCRLAYVLNLIVIALIVIGNVFWRRRRYFVVPRSFEYLENFKIEESRFQQYSPVHLDSTTPSTTSPKTNSSSQSLSLKQTRGISQQVLVVEEAGCFYGILIFAMGILLVKSLFLALDVTDTTDRKRLYSIAKSDVSLYAISQTWWGQWLLVLMAEIAPFIFLWCLSDIKQHSIHFSRIVLFACCFILFDLANIPLFMLGFKEYSKLMNMIQQGFVVLMLNYVLSMIMKSSWSVLEVIVFIFIQVKYLILFYVS